MLLWTLTLAACTTEPTDSADGEDSAVDTDDTALDSGDTAGDTGDSGALTVPTGCELVAMEPLTVSTVDRLDVTWTLECADYGDAATGTWTWEYPGLGENEISATLGEMLELTGEVGGRVSIGRTEAPLRFEGKELLDLPIRFHQPHDVSLSEVGRMAPTWNAIDATPQEASSDELWTLDLDDDGELDSLFGVGTDGEGRPALGLADLATGTWTTSVGKAVFDPASDEIGATYSSVSAGSGVVAAAIVWRMRKKPEILYQEWDDVIGEHLSEVQSGMTETETTFALSPLAERRVAHLGAKAGEFVYWDGSADHTTSAYVGVTPADAESGLAGVGLYATVDVRTEGAPLPSELRAWVLDARSVPKGGALTLDVVAPDTGVRYRSVTVGTLPFTPRGVTAAAADLDGDGTMDLLVEAWGDGAHAAFWVPDADLKSESRPVVELEVPADGTVYWSSPDGQPTAVASSFRTAGGVLVAEQVRASPHARVHVARVWSVDDVVAGSGAVAQSYALGEWRCEDECLKDNGSQLCGTSNHLLTWSPPGAGSATPSDVELVVGDIVAAGPGQDTTTTVLTRAAHASADQPTEVVAVDADTCETALIDRGGGTISIHGGSIVLSDESTLTVGGGSAITITGGGMMQVQGGSFAGSYTFDEAHPVDSRGVASGGEPVLTWLDAEGSRWLGLADAEVLAAGAFKGRGPIQLTGRANYAAAGKPLDLDPRVSTSFTDAAAATLPTDGALGLREVDTGAACPLAATLSDLRDPDAAPIVLATSDDPDCADLLVPLAVLRGVPGAELAVLLAGGGDVRVDVIADGQLRRGTPTRTLGFADVDVVRYQPEFLTVGDFDGDTIDDVLVDAGVGRVALFSDGAGGFTEVAIPELANAVGAISSGPGQATCPDWVIGTPGVSSTYLRDLRNE